MGITTVLAVSLLTIVPGQAQTAGDKAVEPARAPETARVKADGIEDLLADGKVFFLDVRNPGELEENGTLEGYVNIPIDQLEGRLDELPKDRAILTA